MGEDKSKNLSISFRVDDGVVDHNNRKFIAKNVDAARIGDNITYVQHDIKDMYDRLFGEALAEYNAKQKQVCRKIKDYYDKICKSTKTKPFYELIVQFGDMESCGQNSGKWEEAKLMLDEYIRGFAERNPNLKVFNAVMHLDEATPHLHIDFIPIAHHAKQGLSVRVSMKGALQEQGFSASCKLQNEWSAWEERERETMTAILHAHDLTRDVKNANHGHLSVDDYKIFKAEKDSIARVNAQINKLKEKNSDELSPEEVGIILNQNNVLRDKIAEKNSTISNLTHETDIWKNKAHASHVEIDIYSDDKLRYITDELTKANIPFIEGSTSVMVPDYAVDAAKTIEGNYREHNTDTIRDRIALDIDRLVYNSSNFEDLLEKLKELGYEVKNGKYVAVKPPFGERFIRLKSLNAAYLPKNLDKRISERGKFVSAIQDEFKSAPPIKKHFYAAMVDITVAIRQFRLAPVRSKKIPFYAFHNDDNINYIASQLLTMGELNINSKEQLYKRKDETQKKIDDLTEKLRQITDEAATLKSDIAQLRFLFSARSSSGKQDAMTKTKIAAAEQIADKYGIKDENDISGLEDKLNNHMKQVEPMKKELTDAQNNMKRIRELKTAFEQIVEGNYIDNLIKAQKDKELSRQDKTHT